MNIPRHRSSRMSRILRFWAAGLCVVAMTCSAPLAEGTVAAGSRSHAHRFTTSALPASSFVETSNSRPGKRRKGTAHGKSATAVGAGHGGTHEDAVGKTAKAKKGARGRKVQPVEPTDDAVPMRRAGARARHGGREFLYAAGGRNRRSLTSRFAADRTSRTAGKSPFASMRASAAPLRWQPAPHTLSPNPAANGAAAMASSNPFAGPAHDPSASALANAGERAYAEGVSHPEGEENLLPGAEAAPSKVTLGSAEVIAAPVFRSSNSSLPPQSPVVQGFGGEVALAPTEGSATRRRNHPISGSALSGMAAPPLPATLEERDAITSAAVSPAVLPEIYDRNGRLVMPAPLRGSREVLIHQNTMANNDGLERIRDDAALDRLRAEHALVSFPLSGSLHINEDLPYNRRCARPWTVQFAADIARDFYNRFHQPLQVNSAVRTVMYQARLQRVNGNAAATDGDAASPHLTGQAIDFGKRGMNTAQLAWMRAYLLPLIEAGKIDVEEEFQQACFHISVYRRYTGGRLPAHMVAQMKLAAHTDAVANADELRATP